MAWSLVRVEFQPFNGLPRDVVVNTFAFETGAKSTVAAAAVVDALDDFWQTTYSGANLGVMLSTTISRVAAPRVSFYAMDDPEPRVPWYEDELSLLPEAVGGENMPQEVSICLSFHAVQESGAPQARRRGRVYLGPWKDIVLEGSGAVPGRPTEQVMDTIVAAAVALESAVRLTAPWGVWSRRDSVGRFVVGGWVDDEFDTQRRREHGPLSRTLWTAS